MKESNEMATSGLQPELINIDSVRQESPFKDLFRINSVVLDTVTADMKINGYDPAFPMLVWDGIILDGHTRHKAAQNVGLNQVWIVNYNLTDIEQALKIAIASQLDRRVLADCDIYRLVIALDRVLQPESGTTEAKRIPDKTADMLGPYRSKIAAVRYIAAHVTEEVRQQVEDDKFSINRTVKSCREVTGEIKKRKISGKPRYGKLIRLLDSASKLSTEDELTKDLVDLKTKFEVKRTEWETEKLAAKAAKKAAREAAKAAKKRGQMATGKPVVKNCGKVA